MAVAAVVMFASPWVALAQAKPSDSKPLPRVAVLSFRVHSARPVEYLGGSLADLLRARLEASGQLVVQEAGASKGAAGIAEPGLARQLGVDFVVTGSLTELAGRFSLDVRITPATAGRPAHTQVWTASTEDELLGRVGQVSQAVIEYVVGSAPATVTHVTISGAAGFEQELLRGLRTQPGSSYDPAVVRADLASLRANPSVVSAQAETQRSDQGIAVRFQIVLANPSLRPPQGAGEKIAEIRIRGNRRIEEAAIRSRIGSKPGDRYDPAQVARDVRNVHDLGFFKDVEVFSDKTPKGRVLIFQVEENPVVRQISITGNKNIDSDKIRDILTLTTGSTLDYPLLYENRERIQTLYKSQGYYLADVSFEIEPIGKASVGVNFNVDEKEKLRLRRIVFEGNEHFTDAELLEGFKTKVWHFWSYATSWFDRSGTYSEPLFVQDLRGVERKYSDAGYLQVKVGDPEVIPGKKGLVVKVDVKEGRRFVVGKLDVTGDSTVDIDSLRDKLKLEEGEFFNRSHLTEDVATLTQYYQDRGFYFAQVTPLSNLSPESKVVDVRFDVRKGPLYFVRRVDIKGNTTTVDPVIRREIPIVEGQLYSQRAVMLARQRVEGLGYFENVDFKVKPTDENDQLDLDVTVVEHPTGSFSFGAGYSSQDGLVLTGSLAQSNLFGRGYSSNITVDFGGQTQRFYVNLADPYFLGSDFSLGATASRTDLRYSSFRQEQTGASLVLGHSLSEDNRTRGYLRYSFDQRRLAQDSGVNAAAPILREVLESGFTTSSLVGLSWIQDTRNDRFAPTKGRRLGLSLEGTGLGGFTRFLRLEAQGAFFLGAPRWLLDRSTFALSTRMGWAVPFNTISQFPTVPLLAPGLVGPNAQSLDQIDRDLTLPLTERYFLGGLGQFGLRGFKARSVGPRRPILQEIATGSGVYTPLGYSLDSNGQPVCTDVAGATAGNGNGVCNDLNSRKNFKDLSETDVIGGNKFISSSVEYRFPISQAVGLQGVFFLDMGNAFDEKTYNLFDVTQWRYGTGAGVQWFSPFGPLALVLGFPLDRLSVEKSIDFEFSVGGAGF